LFLYHYEEILIFGDNNVYNTPTSKPFFRKTATHLHPNTSSLIKPNQVQLDIIGYNYVPYCSIESIVEDNKEGYYRVLRQTQSTLKNGDNYEPWLIFFLRTMQKHKIRLEDKIGSEISYLLKLSELSAKIMKLIQDQERITISKVTEKTGANVNTIKKHLTDLVSKGYLIKHGKTRGVWYTKSDY
jgi:Fic family protein